MTRPGDGGGLPAVLHADAGCLVIDKPAGLAVHPGPRTPRSLEDLLPMLAGDGRKPLLPVHRLDRDTSGCLVLARGKATARALGAAFAAQRVAKTYWALMDGTISGDAGLVDAALLKVSTREQGWRVVPAAGGKPARTRWRVLARGESGTLVEFRPETGRTHQIRVHATLIGRGCAISGDPVYGLGGGDATLLHARALSLPAVTGAETLHVTAPAPGWCAPYMAAGA